MKAPFFRKASTEAAAFSLAMRPPWTRYPSDFPFVSARERSGGSLRGDPSHFLMRLVGLALWRALPPTARIIYPSVKKNLWSRSHRRVTEIMWRTLLREGRFQDRKAWSLRFKTLDLFLPSYHKLRRPQQRPFGLGIREGADRFPRRLRIAHGASRRRFERSVALQNLHDLRMGHAIESPVAQNGFRS